ncbi:hypothetical protein ROU88_03360 [Macrococcus capreoli]|uniref:hypothetical protein n=1 Tax=Macrococcus capreoli TaxID=2982690 RepID=UPI0021D5DF00|nr:hypothetical protein [Macrococcus sp. TMW 2.2395]MCU7558313.1 hypothetical protein [Macrococcus sp. TMW 2.2395]
MKKYQIIIPIAVITGITLYQLRSHIAMKNPEYLLKTIVSQYENVTGSVIIYEPEKQEKFGQITHIYRGIINTTDKDFEFTVDAYTGDLIDTKEI